MPPNTCLTGPRVLRWRRPGKRSAAPGSAWPASVTRWLIARPSCIWMPNARCAWKNWRARMPRVCRRFWKPCRPRSTKAGPCCWRKSRRHSRLRARVRLPKSWMPSGPLPKLRSPWPLVFRQTTASIRWPSSGRRRRFRSPRNRPFSPLSNPIRTCASCSPRSPRRVWKRAATTPRVDLVAQYGLFSKFNNYQQYFNRFQRNNGQIGLSFQLPLLMGPGVSAQMAQTQTDISHLRIELNNTRNRVSSDLQKSFRDLKKAETAAEVSRLDLEVAREQLSVILAQTQEGRASLRQVEEARVVENDKWVAFYDAQYAMEKARWNVLRLTGDLVASIEALPGPVAPQAP